MFTSRVAAGFYRAVGLLVSASRALALAAVFVLSAAMVFEVVSRYVFRSASTWSYEISYMAFGAIFVLGIASTQRIGGNIRVDFLKDKLGPATMRRVDVLGYLLLVVPCTLLTLNALVDKLWYAIMSGETTGQTAWNPPLWPYLTVITGGLLVFVCQVVADVLWSKASEPKKVQE